jgi:Fe-S cluster biosynthesis and repair protein YggX
MKYSINVLCKFSEFYEMFAIKKLADMEHFLSLDKALGKLLKSNISDQTYAEWVDKNNLLVANEAWYFKDNFIENESNSIKILLKELNNKNELFNGMKVSESRLLDGHDNIPKLFMYIGKQQISTYLAHNYYILEALSRLFFSDINNPEFISAVEYFVKKNRSAIDKIKSMCSITPEILGQGADGVAFNIGNNHVLKLFKSKAVFDATLDAHNRLFNNPELSKTEAMIYDVKPLGSFLMNPIYYYIIEKMKTLVGSDIEDNFDTLRSKICIGVKRDPYWNDIRDHNLDKINPKAIMEQIKEYSNQISDELNNNPIYIDLIRNIEKNVHAKLNSDWLKLLIQEIVLKYISNRTDLHLGNIGLTPYGEFRYFDPKGPR